MLANIGTWADVIEKKPDIFCMNDQPFLFDKRGTGLSDHSSHILTLDDVQRHKRT